MSKRSKKAPKPKRPATDQMALNKQSPEAINNRTRELIYEVAGALHAKAQDFTTGKIEKGETLVDQIVGMAHARAVHEAAGKEWKPSSQLHAKTAAQLNW